MHPGKSFLDLLHFYLLLNARDMFGRWIIYFNNKGFNFWGGRDKQTSLPGIKDSLQTPLAVEKQGPGADKTCAVLFERPPTRPNTEEINLFKKMW